VDKIQREDCIFQNQKNQPVIDIMDAKDRGYQITIAKTHGINLKQLQKMGNQLGFLTDNFKFNLYFVIPESETKMKFEFVGDTEVNKKVKDYEENTVEELKKLLKDKELKQNGNKDELIKRLLENDKVITETTGDIKKKIKEHLNIKYLMIPKKPLKQLENINEFWNMLDGLD